MKPTALLVYHKNVKQYPEEWIAQFKESILNQTCKDFDIIEADYGGDGNRLFEDSIYIEAKSDNFVECLTHMINVCEGLGYHYIFNTNVDDYYSIDRVEKQLLMLMRGYDVVSSNFNMFGSIENTTEFHKLTIEKELENSHNIIAHPAVAFRTSFFGDYQYDPGEIPKEDLLLWKRAIKTKKFFIMEEVLLFHRIHDSSISAISSKHTEIPKSKSVDGTIGLLLIATGKYKQFVEPLINDIAKNFIKDRKVTVYLFTDDINAEHRLKTEPALLWPPLGPVPEIPVIQPAPKNERVKVKKYQIPSYRFPFATLYRYKIFDFFSPLITDDWLLYMDVDMKIVCEIGMEEIFANDKLTAVLHPGFYKNGGWGSPTCSKASAAYLDEQFRNNYYAGGIQGGPSKLYLEAAKELRMMIDADEHAKVTAEWHDETHWNFLLHSPNKMDASDNKFSRLKRIHQLSPTYCMPESWHEKNGSKIDGMPNKIIAIDKNHEQVRN